MQLQLSKFAVIFLRSQFICKTHNLLFLSFLEEIFHEKKGKWKGEFIINFSAS